jgi:hypothetical protein
VTNIHEMRMARFMLGVLVDDLAAQESVLREVYGDRADYNGSTGTETFVAAMAITTQTVLLNFCGQDGAEWIMRKYLIAGVGATNTRLSRGAMSR